MKHVSVLLNEILHHLDVKPNGIYIDATLGGGGHSLEILKRLDPTKGGFLYCFDVDNFAINEAKLKLKDYTNYEIINANFVNIKAELQKRGIFKIDGIIYDLGMSSFQIDDEKRGFSYMKDAKLDMRFDSTAKISAYDIINTYDFQKLKTIFYRYGEENNAPIIAKKIIESRPITTTFDLVKITDLVNKNQKGHSAKKIFQALRIETNNELSNLSISLEDAIDMLNQKCRICVISFHSLEDRIVKQLFNEYSSINMPLTVDIRGLIPILTLITKHPIYPSIEEKNTNSRSIGAKLRVAVKN